VYVQLANRNTLARIGTNDVGKMQEGFAAAVALARHAHQEHGEADDND
jgi:hypothetical protein